MMSNCSLANMSFTWYLVMECKGMNYFLIPAVLLTAVTLLIDPLILICIFCSPTLRQETRYILLANTLFSDIIFLCFNLTNLSSNALNIEMHFLFCKILMVTIVTSHCASLLTLTFMVIDTYVAVRWPLRYNELLPTSRTRKLVGLVWVVAVVYPIILLVIIEVEKIGHHETLRVCVVLIVVGVLENNVHFGLHGYFYAWVIFCAGMITYCYVQLYSATRSSGIWHSRYSKARMTLLAHTVMLLIYFLPGLVFTVQLSRFHKLCENLLELAMWFNTINLSVLMVLPRACAPYLYGLRYQVIYETVQKMLCKRCTRQFPNDCSIPIHNVIAVTIQP